MDNCSNYQNYFDYLSECLEMFQITEQTKKMTSTQLPETLHSESLTTTQIVTALEETVLITESSQQISTSTQFLESLVTHTEPVTQVTTTTTPFKETEMMTESSEENFDFFVTMDNIEGSSELEPMVKSVKTAKFNYWPTVMITACSWLIIGICVFIFLKYKKRYRVRHPSPELSLDNIPLRNRKSKTSRSERDRIVNDSVISPADNPISIV